MTTSDPSNGPASSPQQPAADAAPASSPAPASTNDGSGDCAEIPAAAHAVLQADITLQVRVPRTVDEVQLLPHKLTLTSDDGSVSQTLPISGAEACDVEGTSMITFTGLAEHHSYALQIDNGDTTYVVFSNQAYDQIGEDDDDDDSTDASTTDDSGGSDGTGDNGTTSTT